MSMKKKLNIYVDRLQGGKSDHFEESLPPDSLQLSDDILTFKDPILVKGLAYLSEDFLIIQFSVDTQVWVACSLCNEELKRSIHLRDVIEEIPIDDIQGAVFDCAAVIRQAILLEIPFFVQCGGEVCKNRKSIEKYLRMTDLPKAEDDTQQPFKDLI
jgi:uncharacterized metal-binding protein YceD (DUF177 family)